MSDFSIEKYEAVLKKLLELPAEVPGSGSLAKRPRVDFLTETFGDGRRDDFAGFMGFMRSMDELGKIKIRQQKAISVMCDMALAALSIGFSEGLRAGR